MEKSALLSVYNKTGIEDIARFLIKTGYSIISTGGTFAALIEAGVKVSEVSRYTGADEILDGRIKTLHPKIHSGLLARRKNKYDMEFLEQNHINSIDVVVVNLYPFAEKMEEGLPLINLVDFIDIGGPAIIRAAAKNYEDVVVISDPGEYPLIMDEWRKNGELCISTRRRLAGRAFALCSVYDDAISTRFLKNMDKRSPAAQENGLDSRGGMSSIFENTALPRPRGSDLPDRLELAYRKEGELRYGENPHQRAAWYLPTAQSNFGALSGFIQHQGKDLSFNNLRDLDAAWRAVSEFEQTACVGVKHAAPCAAALGISTLDAWEKTWASDSLSLFGGIVAFNDLLDEKTAFSLVENFLELITAPKITLEALEVFKTKRNLRVLTIRRPPADKWEFVSIDGGICFQEVDCDFTPVDEWTYPTRVKPTSNQLEDLNFALRVAKHVKSNGIVVAAAKKTLGIGTGQPNRAGAVELALKGRELQGAVIASDAFFPFSDSIRIAGLAGIGAIAQPGGSIRDREVITLCDELGIAMAITGRRHFRH